MTITKIQFNLDTGTNVNIGDRKQHHRKAQLTTNCISTPSFMPQRVKTRPLRTNNRSQNHHLSLYLSKSPRLQAGGGSPNPQTAASNLSQRLIRAPFHLPEHRTVQNEMLEISVELEFIFY